MNTSSVCLGLAIWGLVAPLGPQPANLDGPVDVLSERYALLPGTATNAHIMVQRTERFFSQAVAYSATARPVSGDGFSIADGLTFVPDHGRLVLTKWSRIDPPFEVGVSKSGRVMGELFCGRGQAGRRTRRLCFRDENDDGRFDAVAPADPFFGGLSRGATLAFTVIDPQPYRRAAPSDEPVGPSSQRLSLMTTTAGEGQLRILLWLDVEPVVSGIRPGIRQSVVVRRQAAPARIDILGGSLTVHGFNDRTAEISMQSAFAPGEMSFQPVAPGDARQGVEIVVTDR